MDSTQHSKVIADIVAYFVIIMVLFIGLFGLVSYVFKGDPSGGV